MYKFFFKRFFDFTLALVGILISAPIWLITILGILINDFGPIFYKATRIGKDDKEFKMYKFRSMKVLRGQAEGCEASLRPDQDRIFAWGKVIRRLKLDELPQLINILLGDMSVVGPRPVAKDQINIFRTDKYDEAKKVRPGLTGLAALFDYIYGDRFDDSELVEYEKEVLPIRKELEIVYTHKASFLLDLKIFFWTASCVLCNMFGKTPKKLLNKLINLAMEENSQLKNPLLEHQ